ncbi:glycosyltransferase [Arthrobacter sulfonylureivorans]|uniref:D-inositol 3-phosphate glycosyltransferase n=1 Tax=Arthrobacter sulfonylureivorans TaxID=2486855 RepID=A0ABY3WFM3_9MICC|nr:glycosyltransferase [Arthrobacter sulfonylureivorans]UNK47348.1 glycosyltransferase [Arthrobacter sulfonylureivorans]
MAENFPLPRFETSWGWTNQWCLGNTSSAQVELTDDGFLSVEKLAAYTVHLILNGEADDLKSLKPGSGVQLPAKRGHGIIFGLVADVSGSVKVQLVIHEFSRDGKRISREVVDNGYRSIFIADPRAHALLLTVRLSGLGSLTIKHLQATEHDAVESATPGIYPMGKAVAPSPGLASAGAPDIGAVMTIRRALMDAVPLRSILTVQESLPLALGLVSTNHLLEAKEVVRDFDLYSQLPLSALQKMLAHARDTGYLVHALACAEEIERRGTKLPGRRGADELARESDFLKNPWRMMPELAAGKSHDPDGPILHLVGKCFPKKQNGYTIRTKHTAEAQFEAGLNPVIAVQSGGINNLTDEQQLLASNSPVRMISLGDSARSELKIRDWIEENVSALYELVKQSRPRVIHAHSNFVNVVLATHVGEALSVPVVYEVRGIWEESWLTRTAQTEQWLATENGIEMFGLPEYFEWTEKAERAARERVSHIVTLSKTLKEFIVRDESPGVQAGDVTVIPNAAVNRQPPGELASQQIRGSLDIKGDALVFGYISTLAAHEDIETLIDAYEIFARSEPAIEHRLLIVGAGPKLNELQQVVRERQLDGVNFTGRVDHENVASYYAAIDVFVTPRSMARVTQLVTPLKPFEAMASGCINVLADIPALREVGEYGDDTVSYFPPGDREALADIFKCLVSKPEIFTPERRKMRIGKSSIPTWQSNAKIYKEVYENIAISVK